MSEDKIEGIIFLNKNQVEALGLRLIHEGLSMSDRELKMFPLVPMDSYSEVYSAPCFTLDNARMIADSKKSGGGNKTFDIPTNKWREL